MIFCEECRIRKKWPKHPAYPYAGRVVGQCQICEKSGDCHDVLAIRLTSDADKTLNEKALDKVIQQEYNRKCEHLVITHLDGHIDHPSTVQLSKVFVKVGQQVDWLATYELRVEIQKQYRLEQQRKRDRRQA